MPIATSGRVLVTGANGFFAIWVVDSLLKHGYAVRATVRSAEKGVHLTKTFGAYADKLEITVIEDFTIDGAFDKAVQGVDAIIHIASPVHFNAVEPSEIIEPAVKGTTSLLNSVISHGSSVKRIVYTSSGGTVASFAPGPQVFYETNWNEAAVQQCEEKGRDAMPMFKYIASKVLAEKAAWDLFEKHKASSSWDLVSIIPPYIFGPVLHAVSTPETLNGSMREWYDVVFKAGNQISDGFCWIDVRDLADTHVKAITVPEAGGERIIVSAGTFKWQDWFIAARKFSDKATVPSSSYDPATATHMFKFDTTKMERIFGTPALRSIEGTTADIVKDFIGRGWLN